MKNNPGRAINTELYVNAPIPKAFFQNAIPAMLSMLLVLCYNLADMFFVGQTGDPLKIAAVSVATPAFMLFTALGTLFGTGGASCISRALGADDPQRARRISSFCFWGGLLVGVLGAVCFLLLTDPLLTLLGASGQTRGFAASYLRIVAVGAPFIIFSNTFSHVVRTEGKPNVAVIGMIGGNLLNIVLDPLFILALDMGVAGAAVATAVANVAGGLYYILYFLLGKSALSISPRLFTCRGGVAKDVLSIGLPGSLQSILMSVASIVVNNLLAAYSDFAVAAMGVAQKIDMVTSLLMIGMSQGVMPVIGYNYAARNFDRAKKLIRFAAAFSVAVGAVLLVACWIGAGAIVRAFIDAPEVYDLGVKFVHCLLVTSPIVGMAFLFTFALQAMGAAAPSLVLSLTRQCLAYIPALYLLNWLFGLEGIAFALPVANLTALLLSFFLYLRTDRRYRAAAAQHG